MLRLTYSVIVVLLLETNYSYGADQSVVSSPSNHDGFGYEVIQSKLDFLEYRFSELFVQLKEQAEAFQINQERVEAAQQQLNRIVERHERKILQLVQGMEDSFGSNVSLISDQSRRILELQTICSNHELIRNSLFELRPKTVSLQPKVEPTEKISVTTVPECSKLPGRTSGLCSMDIGGSNETVVYMEQQRFGGDWLIIMQRFDGSEDFNRNWTDYRDGFGTVGQEFWLGLEKIHILTGNVSYELLIELEDFSGNYSYARYNNFSINAENDLYRLKELGTYSGTAGDSFSTHKGKQFSAVDKGPNIDCVTAWTGGWWYFTCFNCHLTGTWQRNNSSKAIVWMKFGSSSDTALKFVRMMIRKL